MTPCQIICVGLMFGSFGRAVGRGIGRIGFSFGENWFLWMGCDGRRHGIGRSRGRLCKHAFNRVFAWVDILWLHVGMCVDKEGEAITVCVQILVVRCMLKSG